LISDILEELLININNCEVKVKKISEISHKFDFNKETPGNGLRSFVRTFEKAVSRIHKDCLKLKKSRMKLFVSLKDHIRCVDINMHF
jgi:hypothetical protein